MGLRICPSCGRQTRPMANFYAHVEVITSVDGAISTRAEDRLEYVCGWCGTRIEAGRPVEIADVEGL